MVDTKVNWVTHNVRSVYQNWVEYVFPWKTEEEYNALLSRYNELLADYQNLSKLPAWVRLYNNVVSYKDWSPSIYDNISWSSWSNYYWCALCSLEGSSSNSLWYALYTYKKSWNSDISYAYNESSSVSWSIYSWTIRNATFWNNGSTIKAYFFVYTTYTSNDIVCYECVWNYTSTSSASVTNKGRGSTFNFRDYGGDVTWYWQVSGNSRVSGVTWNEINDDAYIYLTLK